jgi:DNA-binding YbaB/EbfC family protein
MSISMLKQALELKSKMDKAQKELAKMRVEAEAGKGAVRVTATGTQKLVSIEIAPEAIDPAKSKQLESLVIKAVNEALDNSNKLSQKHLKSLTSGLNIPGLT